MGPAHVVNVVDEAIKTSLARRTVSHITIPKDIQEWTASYEQRSAANIPKHSAHLLAAAFPLPKEKIFEEAAQLINAGSKVAILAGRGSLGCREELLQLAEKVAGPIAKPLLGKAAIPDDNLTPLAASVCSGPLRRRRHSAIAIR